jgi:hypothetical protein
LKTTLYIVFFVSRNIISQHRFESALQRLSIRKRSLSHDAFFPSTC